MSAIDMERGYVAEQVRARQIFRPLRKFLRGDALDYGCCHGAFLEELKECGCNAVGADIDAGFVACAGRKGSKWFKLDRGSRCPSATDLLTWLSRAMSWTTWMLPGISCTISTAY